MGVFLPVWQLLLAPRGHQCHTGTAALVSVSPWWYKGRGWASLQHTISKHFIVTPGLTHIAFVGIAWKHSTTSPSHSEMLIAHEASWQGVVILLNKQINKFINIGIFGRCLLLQCLCLCGTGLWKGMSHFFLKKYKFTYISLTYVYNFSI